MPINASDHNFLLIPTTPTHVQASRVVEYEDGKIGKSQVVKGCFDANELEIYPVRIGKQH